MYRRKVAELKSALRHPQDRDEAVTIIRSLIDYVVVVPIADDFRVEFVGVIANMIKIPHKNSAINTEQFEIAVKWVAGARNCLNLLLKENFDSA